MGDAVPEALEAPDLHAELFTCFQVGEGALEGLFEAAHHLGAQADRGAVEDRIEHVRAAFHFAEHARRIDGHAVEVDHGAVATVDQLRPLDLHAVRVAVDHEQGEAVAIARAARRARHDHDLVGDVAVQHVALGAAHAESAAVLFGLRLDRIGREATLLLEGEGEHALAAADIGEQVLLERLAAAEQQSVAAEQHRRDEGLRREHATALAEHHPKLAVAHVGAADGLGERNADPAELAHLLPEIPVNPVASPPVAELSHALHGRLLVEEGLRHVAQDQLVFAEDESHRFLPLDSWGPNPK